MLPSQHAAGRSPESEAGPFATHFSSPSRVLVYVEESSLARRLIPYAIATADALEAPLTLLHVLDVPASSAGPADPVEWNVRRQEVDSHVRRVASELGVAVERMDVRVLEGKPIDQIDRCVRELEAGVTVIGIESSQGAADWDLGETARKLVDRNCCSLLLVPPLAESAPKVRYRRVLVPLDGSSWAESVLPLAVRLAKKAGAELLLAHVIPDPELTETGPLEEEDHRLRRQMIQRNERVAKQYIDSICLRLERIGLVARGLIKRDGDVRGSLARLAVDEQADLTILSAHGRSGRPDVACGSVAAYMITHARAPLLLVMGAPAQKAAERPNGRVPSRPLA
jgi:nucleotide-binding universal stress UspA family protein